MSNPYGNQFWIYCYLLNGIAFDLDKHKSSYIQKITNFATNNFSFFTHHTLSDLGKLDLITLPIASRIIQERLHT